MKAAPRYLGRAGGELAKERLSQYVRYAELVAEQEEALERGDLDRFDELGARAAELRELIGSVTPDARQGDEGAEQDAAKRALEGALAANGRIQDRLTHLRRENADTLRNFERRRPQARRYVSDSSDEEPTGRLDVKL